MRVLLAVSLFPMLASSVGCADNAIPAVSEASEPAEPMSTRQEEQPPAQAQPDQLAATMRVRNPNLLMRLAADLDVFQFIGRDRLLSHTCDPRIRLLADG